MAQWRQLWASTAERCANGEAVSTLRAPLAWRTARRAPTHRHRGLLPFRRLRSRLCGVNVCLAPQSRAGSAARHRQLARCFAGLGLAGSRRLIPNRRLFAMSASGRVNWSILIPRGWAASTASDIASPATASARVRSVARVGELAGKPCTWPSTTHPGWPRSEQPGLYRRDMDQDQHGASAWLGGTWQASAWLRAAWTLAHPDLPGRAALRPADRPLCLRRPDQRPMLPRLCRAIARARTQTRRHRRHGQSWLPQGRRHSAGHQSRRRKALVPAAILPGSQSDRAGFLQNQALDANGAKTNNRRHVAPPWTPRLDNPASRMRKLSQKRRICFRQKLKRSSQRR